MDSAFTPINPLWNKMSLVNTEKPAEQSANGGSLFTGVFQSAIDNVRNTDAKRNELEYQMAVGELDNPAELSIAAYKAQMSVDMLVQLRNKSLEAYSELMRISI